MKCIFVESKIFEKYRDDHLNGEEFRQFQAELMSNPKQGDVIQCTGGLRKIRVASKGRENVVVHVLFITSLMVNDVSIYSLFIGKMKCQI